MDDDYRLIPDYPGYRVSRFGEVQSCWIRRGRLSLMSDSWHALSPYRSKGYAKVKVPKDGRFDAFRIHRLVLLLFVGPAPDGMIACHNDGDPSNNRLDNLRWDSFKANCDDRLRHGTLCRGEAARHAKLKESDVLEIRRLRAEGHSSGSLAERFAVSIGNIRAIVQGRTWRHLLPTDDVHGPDAEVVNYRGVAA